MQITNEFLESTSFSKVIKIWVKVTIGDHSWIITLYYCNELFDTSTSATQHHFLNKWTELFYWIIDTNYTGTTALCPY